MGSTASVSKPVDQGKTKTPPQAAAATSVVAPAPTVATTNVCTTLKYNGQISVFYGSETGTADMLSSKLTKQGNLRGLKMKRYDLADVSMDEIRECKFGVFMLSNRGEGEPSCSASKFYEWIENKNRSLGPDTLKGLHFCVFGLGNSTYVNTFNKVGRTTNAYLEILGGTRIFEYTQGDDSQDMEGDFTAWMGRLLDDFVAKYHPSTGVPGGAAGAGPAAGSPISKTVNFSSSTKAAHPYVPTFTDGLVSVTHQLFSVTSAEQHHALLTNTLKVDASTLSATSKHFFTATPVTVAVNKELRTHASNAISSKLDDHALATVGSTRHMELDITNSCIFKYETAENVGILPRNCPSAVATVAASQGYDLTRVFELTSTSSGVKFKPPFPYPCSLEDALLLYFDIAGPLHIDMLSELIPFVVDPTQKEWLVNLLKPENNKQYQDCVKAGHMSFASLAQSELSSLKLPFAEFVHLIPLLKPRYYTISSSYLAYPQSIHLTLSVLTQKTTDDSHKLFKGCCSSYLASCTNTGVDRVRIFLTPSTFKLPHDPTLPVVMIGPGTGLAPMRAILQERAAQHGMKLLSNGKRYGSNTLYFGCRRRHVDYIYAEELREFVEIGILTKLHVAFSREEKEKKVYVQDLLLEEANGDALMRDLDAGGYVYICGATRMGADVVSAIEQVVMSRKGLNSGDAKQYVANLFKTGRLVQELWSSA